MLARAVSLRDESDNARPRLRICMCARARAKCVLFSSCFDMRFSAGQDGERRHLSAIVAGVFFSIRVSNK